MTSHRLLFIHGFLDEKGKEKYEYPELKLYEAADKRRKKWDKTDDADEKLGKFVDEEKRELHAGSEPSPTGYPRSDYSNRLIYQNNSLNLEESYYWVLTQLQVDKSYRKDEIIKVTDIFSASEMSTYWGTSSQRLGIQQDKASQFLKGISEMVKSMFQLIRDLGIIDEKINYYKSSFSDNEKESSDGELVLKGQFVDLVEGGTQNPSSVFGLSQKVGFTMLPDFFFRTHIQMKEDIEDDEIGRKVTEAIETRIRGKIANKQFQDVLQRKLSQYYRWKIRTYKQLKINRNVFKSYLRQHYNTIRLYMQWIRPYLINIKRLTTSQRMADSPELVSAFEGNMIEIEILANKTIAGYKSCIIANFQYRTVPHLDYIPNYGQQRSTMTGRVEINLKTYTWTQDQVKSYIAMKEEEDLDMLKEIMGGIQEGMDSMTVEVMKYLNEDKEKEEKEEKEKVSIFEPFTELTRGLGSVFKFTRKEKPGDKTAAAQKSKNSAFQLFHYYKKAHKLVAW